MDADISKVVAASTLAAFCGWKTFFGYFTQIWFWRFRVNIFWRPDPGQAMHDHAWDFVSFPFVPYVEEYLDGVGVKRQVIHRFRLNRKPAEHSHRYLGKWSGVGVGVKPGVVWTFCYAGSVRRAWFYWRVDKKVRKLEPVGYLRRIVNKPQLGVRL